MKRYAIEMGDEELASCTPQVQEAFLRILRTQNPEHFQTDTRSANERLRDSIKKGPTEQEFEQRRSQVSRPDGITIVEKPNITPRR